MEINGYKLTGELNNANSGFSKWGFAKKRGNQYFIKELINPVYPMDPGVMSAELFESRREFCKNYENRCRNMYEAINRASRGNLVRIIELFRADSKYYIVTEKIENSISSVEHIAAQPEYIKFRLLKTAAYAFACLHSAGIVHFDVKPANIIVSQTRSGMYTARLIDFDSGFFKDEIRSEIELGGDLTYLAPETFLAIYGEDSSVDEKADIFSLGLVFHQYFCGELPGFDTSEYEYPYEAVLDGVGLQINSKTLPPKVYDLVTSMLDIDPQKRPSASKIVDILGGMIMESTESFDDDTDTFESEVEEISDISLNTAGGDWFHRAGDL